jgi:hypothetical protein
MRDGVLRRIVVNPEKEQIKRTKPGETIVTEIEQLARLYPYAEPIELKVKSLINFVTQDVSFTQIERLERAVLQVLKGSMDDVMFYEYLTKPLAHGGAGMHPEETRAITRRVFSLFRYSIDVQRFRENIHADSRFMHQRKFLDRVLLYIKDELRLDSTPDQLAILKTAVAERVGGIINADDFLERLVLSLPLGGAAYQEDQAFQVSRHLEKLIAQGGYIIQPNELLGAHT